MKRRWAVVLVAALTLAGCAAGGEDTDGSPDGGTGSTSDGGGPAMEDGKYVVRLVAGNRFEPAELTIPAGATVVWVTESGVHDVTEGEPGDDASEWSSEDDGPKMTPGVRYERTFNETGTVHYRCVLHESSNMVGTLTVT